MVGGAEVGPARGVAQDRGVKVLAEVCLAQVEDGDPDCVEDLDAGWVKGWWLVVVMMG